jgi:gentisate 1,2-dioxygenase
MRTDIDAWDGVETAINPVTVAPIPTMATFITTPALRVCRQTVAADTTARCSASKALTTVHLARGDKPGFSTSASATDVIPRHCFLAAAVAVPGCVLFQFSDRPVHQAPGHPPRGRLP